MKGKRTVFNSKVDLFPKLAPKEKYHTASFDTLALKLASNITSYRVCDELLNHVIWQGDGEKIKYRSLRDFVSREGNKMLGYLDSKAEKVLKAQEFNVDTGEPVEVDRINENITNPVFQMIDEEIINSKIDEYNEGKSRKRQIDEVQIKEMFVGDENCINVSIDDIGTVEQKESGRTKYPEPKEGRHYVKNTVIHIQQDLNKYILVGLGIMRMMLIMLAFLLENDELKNKHLIFFTDGASDIRKAIKDMFGWRSHQILLDWYHLREKCKQRLSMAMKGKDFRNEAVKDVLSILWAGNVEDAVKYLKSIDDNKIRNKAEIERLIGYFDKNWSYIPCYALRQKLGLRVSSNRGEKANDLVVAKRQKHNGMSWSKYGSSGLANVSSIFLNNESENWIIHRNLNFNFNTDNSKIAA